MLSASRWLVGSSSSSTSGFCSSSRQSATRRRSPPDRCCAFWSAGGSRSDPGAILVSECRRAGLKVEIVPGASAVVSAVALSGITSRGFTFLGFLPEKRKDKEELVKDFKFSSEPVVFYVSPHEINDDAKFLHESFGERRVFVIHELTKMFESVEEQNLSSFSIPSPKGEYVLIVMPSTGGNALSDSSSLAAPIMASSSA